MKRFIVNLFLVFLFVTGFSSLYAQITKVTGRVIDGLTNEPIPFASVAFKKTTIGANTDINGNFSIQTDKEVDSVIAACVGYKPVVLPVRKHQEQKMNFVLKVNKVELREVTIKAGENPADIIMRKVIENKAHNDKDRYDTYQYEVYNKVEFDLTDITEQFKKKKLLKPFAFIWDNMDSTTTNGKPFLPFFISEALSDVYFRKHPLAKKEIIKASKVSGMENTTITQFLGDMYQNVNIYDNYIDVFGKNFVSPVNGSAFAFYKFYLMDSAFIDNNWCYKLKFKPRRKQELTFVGEMWIHDTTFAIKKADMRIAEDANINFINDLAVVKEYKQVGDSMEWMLTKDMLVIDFKARQNGMGFIGRKTTSYKDFVINKPIDKKYFADMTNNIEVKDDALDKDMNYWANARHDSLSDREKQIYHLVDTIKTVPAFKTYIDIITLFITGYYDIGMVGIGPYFTFASFNDVEGFRLRLGGQTNTKFSKDLQLNGYVAYGFKDENFKYGGGFRYFISHKPRLIVGGAFKYDVQQLGQSQNAFQDDNILSSIFRRDASNKLTFVTDQNVYIEREWFDGFSNRITFSNAYLRPLGDLNYDYYSNESKTDTNSTITTSDITFYTRFQYRERFVQGKTGRVSLGSNWPELQLGIRQGLKGVLKSDFSYTKIGFKLADTYNTPPLGYLYYQVEVAKAFGTVPYPLLYVHKGNETYFYDYDAFNMMNYYEFASDAYVSLFATQHFEGLFLNRIPLMRKLKWREVFTFKAASGTLSKENQEILVESNTFSSLIKPYVEVGAGVENILKVFRVDFIWRLTYINADYKIEYKERFPQSRVPAEFGIRASFQLIF